MGLSSRVVRGCSILLFFIIPFLLLLMGFKLECRFRLPSDRGLVLLQELKGLECFVMFNLLLR